MREDRDSLVERLHRQTAEYSAFKLENERLKVWMHGELRGHGQAASMGEDEPGFLRCLPGHALIRRECPGAGEPAIVSVPPHPGCRPGCHLVSLLRCREPSAAKDVVTHGKCSHMHIVNRTDLT